jgi:alpha-galactosidase
LTVRDLEHDSWNDAAPVSLTRLWSGSEADAGSHAEVRLQWTEFALLARFVCNQTQPLIINSKPTLDQKTMGLWDRDVCEVFLSPNLSHPQHYFEFEAAPTGEWIDVELRFVDGQMQRNFDFASGMKTASVFSEDSLMVGIEIPWSISIPRPSEGELWAVNLFRCVGLGKERYLAWQPTFTAEPNFHVPEAFGRLLFS